ncbi:pilus assembly protein CpaD [Novosphingobium sp. PC22D]|uniref:CpaD family pilus assembly protein n=1 Tax=Novosphingobium sp. PC22D TaxID=1962403 RepID=UPI000BF15FDC|nr:CpaD family pilus assembly protein [Novosphingobium sp. PC22D]PEQ14641.1 pilus assembly protein CpaD [Novosphingobium sp. PC22D]
MFNTRKPGLSVRTAAAALALSTGLTLAGCGGMPSNRSLYSVHQPVVERVNYTLDVASGSGGLSYSEQRRLDGWFDAMDLKYGDKVYIDDPLNAGSTRDAVETLASRHGILVESGPAPTTAGYVAAGTSRVVITRHKASVPSCPDWSARSDVNLGNATSSNYGCANNSNLAAMVANPEHLINGAEGTGETVVMSSTKAIDSYRKQAPSGSGGLTANNTGGGGN